MAKRNAAQRAAEAPLDLKTVAIRIQDEHGLVEEWMSVLEVAWASLSHEKPNEAHLKMTLRLGLDKINDSLQELKEIAVQLKSFSPPAVIESPEVARG